MKLDRYQQSHLQNALSGMTGGFSLFDDRLYVRKDSMTYGFILTEIRDSSKPICYGCGEELPGRPQYWVKVVEEFPNSKPETSKKPLCYDCAVPQ